MGRERASARRRRGDARQPTRPQRPIERARPYDTNANSVFSQATRFAPVSPGRLTHLAVNLHGPQRGLRPVARLRDALREVHRDEPRKKQSRTVKAGAVIPLRSAVERDRLRSAGAALYPEPGGPTRTGGRPDQAPVGSPQRRRSRMGKHTGQGVLGLAAAAPAVRWYRKCFFRYQSTCQTSKTFSCSDFSLLV